MTIRMRSVIVQHVAFAITMSLSHVCLAPSLRAQTDTLVIRPRLCFRGEPAPRCDRFVITEMGYYKPVTTSQATLVLPSGQVLRYPHIDPQLTVNVGAMVNRGSHSAVGGTVLFGFGGGGAQLGVLGRYRRWLTADGFAVDVAAGLVQGELIDAERYLASRGKAMGVTGELALNAGDYGAVVLRLDMLRRQNRENSALYLGARLGSKPAVGASIVLLTLSVLVVAALNGSDF